MLLPSHDVPPAPFVTGINLPWMHYGGDFGANAWRPRGGIAERDRRHELDAALGRLAERGVRHLRWFLLADARAGVTVDAEGRPAGLDDAFVRDLATALDLLERHGIRVLFALLDFLLAHPAREVAGVSTRGRISWLRDAAAREQLATRVLAPIAAQADGSPALAGWDLLNEPEWITWGWGGWHPRRCVSRKTMRRFLAEARAAVRSRSRAPITVGLASTRGLPLVSGLGLDAYHVHWYDHVEPASTLVTPVRAYALDAPLWLGEFPTAHSGQSPLNVLAAVQHAGYAGAFAWSYRGSDPFSSPTVCEGEIARFAARHAAGLAHA